MEEMEEKKLPSNSSYIVLNRCTDDENNEMLSFPNFELQLNQDKQLNISTLSPCMAKESQVILPELSSDVKDSTVDIEKHLSDLLAENVTLKETLHQNNLAMKQQFNTLCLWQEEVLKVHQSHKERFDETKQLIFKLMTENKELKTLNEQNQKKPEIKQLEKEKEDLMKQLQEKESKLNQLIVKMNKRRCQQPSVKEKELGTIVEMLTERLEIAERARRQLEIDVERLAAQKSRLEQRIADKDTLKTGGYDKNKGLIIDTVYSPILREVKDYLGHHEKRLANSGTLTCESRGDDEDDPKKNLSKLKINLLEEQTENARIKQYLTRIAAEYEKFLVVHSKMAMEVRNNPAPSHFQEFDRKKEDTEALDVLLAKVMSRDEEIIFKNEQIDALKCRLKMLEAENEAVQILKAQVAVYQSDFNIERKNREDLAAEREKLLSDMRQLLKHNKQLMEEINRLQGTTCPNTKTCADEVTTNIESQEEIMEELSCPNPDCTMKFSKVEPLQVHVEQCLKLN